MQNPVAEWTKQEVREWLVSLDLEEYAIKFKRTNGARLALLTEQDIKSRFSDDIEAAQNCWADLRHRLSKTG